STVALAERAAAITDVRYLGTAAIDAEAERLRVLAGEGRFADLFLTAPSPGIVATTLTNRHYATIEDYVDALADGLAQEYRAVVDAGLLLQIDAPDLALERHVLYAARPIGDFVAFARDVVAPKLRALVEGAAIAADALHL